MRKLIFLFTLAFLVTLIFPTNSFAQTDENNEELTFTGEVIEVNNESIIVKINSGEMADERVEIDISTMPTAVRDQYSAGDLVMLAQSPGIDGNTQFYITDFVRGNSLLFLFILFASLAIIVGGWWGLSSLVGMAFSFGVIFWFILPRIVAGWNPVLVAILGSGLIIPVTFYMSHGINKKTNIAVVGTIVTLLITGVLATIFVELTHLTGFAAEEASFLNFEQQGLINMKGILLAGIIIGVLGILDDITVSQASIVNELREANRKLTNTELFQRAMKVGRDHIASLVNTLVLVYTGASLPLLLLFINNPRPFEEIINYEVIADEIVRTLVGSIGLILAVPITTFLATLAIKEKK